jgi:hypothetical protein
MMHRLTDGHPRPFEKADGSILRTVLVSGEFYLRHLGGAARNKGGQQ